MESLMQSSAFPWVVAAAIGLAAFLIVFSMGQGAQEILKESELVSVERAGFLLYITPILRRLSPLTSLLRTDGLDRYRRSLPQKMIRGGLEGFMEPEEYMAFHLFCGLITLPFIAYTNFVVVGADTAAFIMFSVPFFLIGAIYPAWFLIMKRDQRHKSIFRDLPYVMDLLTVAVEAGVDFQGGIAKVVEKGKPGPLRDELKRMLNQMQLGTSRVDSLREMSDRVGLSYLRSLTSALIQAARLGSSIGPILRVQSEMLRTKRSQLAEEMAGKAPVKMIFPIVIFIFPSIFLVLLGPVLIKAVYTAG